MSRMTMNFFYVLDRYMAALRAARAEIRTERMIAEMPDHLRKDIGWPDRDRLATRRRS